MLAHGKGDGFGAVGGAELGEDRFELLLDGDVRDAELSGDVMIGEAFGHGRQQLKLMVGQAVVAGFLLLHLQEMRGDDLLAGVYVADGRDEGLRCCIFQKGAGRAVGDSLGHFEGRAV